MHRWFSAFSLIAYSQLLWPLYFDFFTMPMILLLWGSVAMAIIGIRLPSWCFAVLVPASFVWIVYLYATFLDPEAASSFLFLLLILKQLELRQSRDYFSLLMMTLLLLCTSALFMEGVWQFILAFFHLFFIFIIWFVSTPEHLRKRFRNKSEYAPAVISLLLAVPMAFVLFIFFPRFDGGFISLARKGQGKIGHSLDVKIDDVTSIRPSDEVVFRVEADFAIHPSTAYWRGNTLWFTDGFNWFHQKPHDARYDDTRSPLNHKHPWWYQVELVKRNSDQLFLLEPSLDVHTPGKMSLYHPHGQTRWVEKKQILHYYNAHWAPEEELIDKTEDLSRYLKVPKIDDERFEALVKTFPRDVIGFIQRMQSYLQQENFIYTLNPGRQESLIDFLLEHKKGFCTHFASAMGILARHRNIPARLVSGFLGAEKNNLANYYVIRDNDAHVWVELYDRDKKQWLRVDPTGFVSAERIDQGGNVFFSSLPQHQSWSGRFIRALGFEQNYQQFSQWMDALNRRWFNIMLSMDREGQKEIAEFLKMSLKNFYSLSFWGAMILWVGIFIIAHFWGKRKKRSHDPLIILKEKFFRKLAHEGVKVKNWRAPKKVELELIEHYGHNSHQVEFWKRLMQSKYGRQKPSIKHLTELLKRC